MRPAALRAWLAVSTALTAAAVGLLAACSSDKPKPAPLQDVKPQVAVKPAWRADVGSVHFPLQVTLRDGRFHLAGDDGTVLVLDAASGRQIWRARVDGKLSAGVGSDGRYDAVVTRDNLLIVLDQGVERWRARLDASVVTAPLVAGERVFVLGVDRVVQAFDAVDGRRLWTLKRPGDALLLSEPGVITAWHDTLLVGQGPRLVGVDPLKGTLRWEVAVTSPRGTNEVERLADLIGPAARDGDSLCMRAFQNAVGCVDVDRTALRWSQNGGGIQPVGGDAGLVVSADASDRITARQRASGDLAWTSELLLNRGLSAPAVLGSSVVFGDYEGQLHFLAHDTGKPVLRLPTDGGRIAAPLLVSGNTLLAVTAKGGVHALRAE